MNAVVTCQINGTRFFLTDDGLATDIPARAATFRDQTDAQTTAIIETTQAAWEGFDWVGAYILANGVVCEPDC